MLYKIIANGIGGGDRKHSRKSGCLFMKASLTIPNAKTEHCSYKACNVIKEPENERISMYLCW